MQATQINAQAKLVAPSILSADFSRLGEEIQSVEKAGADLIHIDVMDGHFVPNLTIGPPVLQSVASKVKRPLDVHLMVEQPERYLEDFVRAGANIVTVHAEACVHLHRVVTRIRELGASPGVSINPATPVDVLWHVLDAVDVVLVMTVNPGFGGQKFLPLGIDKVARLERARRDRDLDFAVEVDGGIAPDTVSDISRAGANIFVAGSAIFGSPDYAQAIEALKQAL